ncbi:MAG: putative molybdenum carrier protein [Gallionella sp.]|nr:putative molybdenum carrier protein [Gallionella sp.]
MRQINNSQEMTSLAKIISGGQAGTDRAALDWAIARGMPHGGWCPEGRLAEDGVIPLHYKLEELPGAGYRQRTRQNVLDSDCTLILNIGELDGGTLQTARFAQQHNKPCCVVQLDSCEFTQQAVRDWMLGCGVLNVAGPRESRRPGIYRLSYDFLDRWLEWQADSAMRGNNEF